MIAPILSEVHVESYLATKQFEQVLCDGENYDGNRPCRYEWVKSLHDQCEKENVRFDFIGTGNVFVKDGKVYRIPKCTGKAFWFVVSVWRDRCSNTAAMQNL